MSDKVIYVIGDKKIKRCYVGETENAKRRISQHIDALLKNKHPLKALQMDYNRHDVLDVIAVYDCNGMDGEQRKIFEKVVMQIYLEKGWQLYNSLPKEENINSDILFDLRYYISSKSWSE